MSVLQARESSRNCPFMKNNEGSGPRIQYVSGMDRYSDLLLVTLSVCMYLYKKQ